MANKNIQKSEGTLVTVITYQSQNQRLESLVKFLSKYPAGNHNFVRIEVDGHVDSWDIKVMSYDAVEIVRVSYQSGMNSAVVHHRKGNIYATSNFLATYESSDVFTFNVYQVLNS